MSITAIVEKNTIKLPPDAGLPDGTRVRIDTIETAPSRSFGTRYAAFIGQVEDAPADLAENHDHYLYGAQKRGA
ncbi:MAG TPA: hypothetical protein VHD62_16915 [Opitutaceae bacterium]|nr:hypothetical protein [Opitutaceae bacterium]